MNKRNAAGALALALLSLQHFPAFGATENIFSCDIGEKQVTVSATENTLRYEFGRPGKPELVIDGDKYNVSYRHETWAHAEDKQLRFRNGSYSYVVFNRFVSPNYQQQGGEDRSGLVVLKDEERIALFECQTGGQFGPAFDLDTLPEDLSDIIPVISQDASASQPIDDLKDDEIREIGRLIAIEDGPYPMYSVTLEFPERDMQASFSLNIEEVEVYASALLGMEGEYVSIHYTSDLEPSLVDMKLDGQSLLDVAEADVTKDLTMLTGILGDAEAVTESDLPSTFFIEDATGQRLRFPFFVTSEMVAANGREVTVYYYLKADDRITYIRAMSP